MILEEGGDYFLFIKSNQKSLMDAVRKGVDGAVAHPRSNNQKVSMRDEGYGRVTCQTCMAVGERLYLGAINDKWTGVGSFGSVTTEGTGRATQTRYFNGFERTIFQGNDGKDKQKERIIMRFPCSAKNAKELSMHTGKGKEKRPRTSYKKVRERWYIMY